MKRTLFVFLCALLLFACQPAQATTTAIPTEPTQAGNSISGIVMDEENHPIVGAVVRIKATDKFTTTDQNGGFVLANVRIEESALLTAYMPGYYIGGGEKEYLPGASNAEIVLKKHTVKDSPDYQWVSAFVQAGVKGSNCESCHSNPKGVETSDEINLPFDEWMLDAHSQSAQNPRFISMYLGQDLHGNQSPLRQYGYNLDYGRIPLRPDLNQPYFGPGYKLDFPYTAGNCAACHTPAASIDDPYGTDPTKLSGVAEEGITCDFCHKVWDVRLGSNGLPQPNMAGVLSFEFRRPPKGHQFFAGPFDDVAPGEDTYTPIQRQSQYCAPCHFGSFWDVQIYNSFGEWLDSPYSDSVTGKTCQECHMPPGKTDHFARLTEGAMIRDPQTIFSHRMPGASDVELLQNAVAMTVDANIEGDQLIVEVKIANDQTGHHVPTDSPLRQMILLVNVTDGQGQVLPLLNGEKIPEWGGVGDPVDGYYAGLPGKIYAKILMELWTEITPSGAYWNPTRVVSDNRIPAFGSDRSTYIFATQAESMVRIDVSLLFRRAFIELMDQKKWSIPDILMEHNTIIIDD